MDDSALRLRIRVGDKQKWWAKRVGGSSFATAMMSVVGAVVALIAVAVLVVVRGSQLCVSEGWFVGEHPFGTSAI